MLNTLIPFCLFFLSLIDAANISQEKPGVMTLMKRKLKFFGAQQYAPVANDPFEEESATIELPSILFPMNFQLGSNLFSLLIDDTAQEILEYLLLEDYAPIRSVSRSFNWFLDNYVYRMSSKYFPEFTKVALRQWDDEAKVTDHLKHRLTLLIKGFFGAKPPSITGDSDSILDPNLKRNAVRLIKYLQASDLDQCLRLANVFLKLEIVLWGDIVHLLFSNNHETIPRAWSLGLTTIANEMFTYHANLIIKTVGKDHKGLLIALKGNHYALSQVLVHSMRSQSHRFNVDEKTYLNDVIAELIRANYWYLLSEIYEMNRETETVSYHHVVRLAELGQVQGLRVLKDLAKDQVCQMTMVAAAKGRLEFLKEMDSFGFLRKSCFLAIHDAASNGHTECLEFLVSRLGIECLGYEDPFGFLPIHFAAGSRNPETMLAILRLYPHYKPSHFSLQIASPLHMALYKSSLVNAKILLAHFPELISFTDEEYRTVIHLAMALRDDSILEFLLELAPPEVITARNGKGDTALHLAHKNERLTLLMSTGLFTAMERNDLGMTPVYVYCDRIQSDRSKVMQIFNLKSEEEYNEALRIITVERQKEKSFFF